jgi:nucleolar protein 12
LGVVKAPERKIPTPPEKKPHSPAEDESDEESDDQGDDEELSEVDGDGDVDMVPDETEDDSGRSRKRKRKAVEEEIEDTYMRKLQDEEEPKPKSKKAKQSAVEEASPEGKEDSDNSDSEDYGEREEAPKTEFPIKHETLVSAADVELDKSARSVFLGNVPSNAISSKSDYKKLKAFFATVGKISSIRFRSIAFSEQIPRKAAFVNHKLHEKQKTVNAYIVYEDAASAREALKLNGSVVLDRHIRVDSVAHPGKQDPKRCVFVGNLDFEAQEENLWKHFGTCGKVEYVRIVRDAKTNVGKGFAYVQFEVIS